MNEEDGANAETDVNVQKAIADESFIFIFEVELYLDTRWMSLEPRGVQCSLVYRRGYSYKVAMCRPL